MDKNTFNYTYSAAQHAEVEKIKKKYQTPTEENKLEALKKLDRSVETPASIAALVIGIVGILIMGLGMSMVMVWENYLLGVIIGIIGILICLPAYPIYKKISEKRRRKLAPQILRLAEEIEREQ